ncbi:ABC transporter ATP-binding protein [Thiohalomonas denitrificans]|uniref:Multiple sugar transport system ATP-binding protein n=1 Tax=Thiohalomonas denitrificans TaxID=415747 RepID=A0A1G5QED6_9GAMM|nr:sn-glycerol-3-phosphate ABC transporter ATP-binding protein UgpC [Thiohalomonas denitrificans]SCZ60255.1 multiple sugar transport system ATP-binding protein [Thiohalomonas denitrificans]
MASVDLENVTKRFGRTEVIKGIDLTIENGRLTVFVGPSGCGKSTLLRLIAGLEEVTSGKIHIGDENVTDWPPAERGVAMVFQSYALYPHMKVFDNMAFGLKISRTKRNEIEERVRHAARILRIEPLLNHKPGELSGGQRQRVAIGRAIVREPKVFLFDEPLSNLDASLRVQMRLELASLQRELDATMVYVTHDQTEAMTLGHTIVVLNEGRVEQVGTPLEVYRNPANRFVAGFIGSPEMNFLELEEKLPIPKPPLPEAVTLGIRPEHVILGDGPLQGKITLVERLGSESFLHLELPGEERVTARASGDLSARPGDTMAMEFPSEHLHFFDDDGRTIQA